MKRVFHFSILILLLMLLLTGCDVQFYETSDLSQYGNITGNYNNSRAQEAFKTLFPEKLDDRFVNPQYHYKAVKGVDGDCFEISLEFTMKSNTEFWAFLSRYAASSMFQDVSFAADFKEWKSVHCYYQLEEPELCDYCKDGQPHYHVTCADIQSVIMNPKEHRIILESMIIDGGGGTKSTDLTWFLDRFNLTPLALDDLYS